jgi:uncharacterized protein
VSDNACEIEVFETIWIPMPDGVRLAARMWMPKDTATRPVPAILEYIPYRRRDGVRETDEMTHPFLAAHRYACVRLDIRGSGDSEGVLLDEYLKQEQDDAVAAIAWIAAQPWCSGAVGMMGISWGGFNSLQVAARRPPALRAVVTLCSTDDRYSDDFHYNGGAHMTANLDWSAQFHSIMARAPDPLIVGESWRVQWLRRLEVAVPMIFTALAHQRRDAYWQHGSVCEDIGAIACPVMAVSGWVDGYTNTVFRLLRNLTTPRLGIVGPWGHWWPHYGRPGPAIGFLTEMLRWWDHWLKGVDTGIMQEPMLRAYVQDWITPASYYDVRPGRWVGEATWPSPDIETQRWYLNGGGLGRTPVAGAAIGVSSPQTTGAAGGEWCPYAMGGVGPDMSLDQRLDDAYSLVFDGAPFDEPLEILGGAVLDLTLSVDKPALQLIVRLNDMAPDGQVARVTYGVLNLTHRVGHERPEYLEPGKQYKVRLHLNDAGHRFGVGHRIRVAISTAYWPIIWPAPERGCVSIVPGSSSIALPVRKAIRPEVPVAFGPPDSAAPTTKRRELTSGTSTRSITYDVGTGIQSIEVVFDVGRSIFEDIAVESGYRKVFSYRIHPDNPNSARAIAEFQLVNRRAGGWDTTIHSRTAVGCTATEYLVEVDLAAFSEGQRIFSRTWTQSIPRDFT